jgi:hypothetical protein
VGVFHKKAPMKKLYLIISLALVVAPLFAQKSTLPQSSFNELDIFGPFDVEIIKSETDRVEVDFNGIDRDDIVTEIHKGTVRLKFKNHHYMEEWKNDNRHSRYVLVKVYYKDIDVVEAGAGAVVYSKETLVSKYLSIDCTMGAEVTLDILAHRVEAISNMGGILKMTGQTDHLDVKANMGGVLKASQLESKTVYVKANMGAEVRVNATEEIEASAGFGAIVSYVGGPSVRHTSRNFGGEVNKREN